MNEMKPLPPSRSRLPHLLELFSEAEVPLAAGVFRVVVFREKRTGDEHVAVVKGDVRGEGARPTGPVRTAPRRPRPIDPATS